MQLIEQDASRLAEETRSRLAQATQLYQLHNMAQQVLAWIAREEQLLATTFALPGSLQESEQLQSEHQQFQDTIRKTHDSIVSVQEKASALLSSDHYAPGAVHAVAERVMSQWRHLCTLTEDRHKLLASGVMYFKTMEQVDPVLDRLEADYQRAEDCCREMYERLKNSSAMSPRHIPKDKHSFVSDQLNRHLENKEKFLKVNFIRKF